jgi:hypothetical protein
MATRSNLPVVWLIPPIEQKRKSMKLTITQRRSVLAMAGVNQPNIPIQVVPGNVAPYFAGSAWHYETAGGSRIWHPSAYASKGWSNMRYIASTRRVVVGVEWLAAPVMTLSLAVAA